MASFSEGFLSALTRPSFARNLFQVGQQNRASSFALQSKSTTKRKDGHA